MSHSMLLSGSSRWGTTSSWNVADGIDTANLRWQNKTSAGIDIRVAEEQSKGTEINHMTEVVGFIAIR